MSKKIKTEIKTEIKSEKELEIKSDDNEIEMDLHLYESLEEIFEIELRKIFKNIVNKYGSEYLFNEDDLVVFYKKMKIEFSFKKSHSLKSKQKDNEDLPNEQWLPVPNEPHDKTFSVSNIGRIKKI